MHDIFSPEPDPLEGMLRPSSPPDNERLHRALYEQTRRVFRRRRRIRQFAYAALLLVSFAAGVGVMRMTTPGERGRGSAPSESHETLTQTPSPDAPEALTQSPSSDTPQAREWIAFDSTQQRGELYREAGDRYLTDEHDLQSALRCYGNALDSGTEQDLAISSDDNWLLMAIKDARQKEMNHAKQGG